MLWKDVRVVECVGLENRYAQAGIGGSNPPLSAKGFMLFCLQIYLKYVILPLRRGYDKI